MPLWRRSKEAKTPTAICPKRWQAFAAVYRVWAVADPGGGRGDRPRRLVRQDWFFHQFSQNNEVMKCMKKLCLYPLSQYFLVLASEALKRGGRHRRFVTVLLMWSETVSVINLQTLKSILKSAQKCAIFTFKFKNFLGGSLLKLSLIHIWRCRRSTLCRSRWSPYH